MSSQQPAQVPPLPEPDDDVDAFSWRKMAPRIRLAMKRLLGLSGDSDTALAAKFGTPPSPDLIETCWPALRDTWLRPTMSDDDIARYCNLYRAGHTPHYIQVFRARRDTDHYPAPCTIVRIANNGNVTVRANGTLQRLWNHDPARLRRIAASGGAAKLHLQWALLTIDSPDGTYNFSMQLNDTGHVTG